MITYDFEFIDNGRTIEPLSLGMVADNGDELYRVFEDGPWRIAANTPWLRENVLDKLPMLVWTPKDADRWYWDWDDEHNDWPLIQPRESIASAVENFLIRHGGPDPSKLADLWAYYPATDHVALYQLFGPMMDCTSHGMAMRTSCLKQEEESLRRWKGAYLAKRPEQDPATEHHALHDARHDMDLARWLGVDR